MKIGEYRAGEFTSRATANKKIEKTSSENVNETSTQTKENALETKNASFVSDVKAINETMFGVELASSSMQKISGDKMEEAMKDLRNITASLKDMLSKSFAKTTESGEDYSADGVKAKLYGTNPTNLHNFDYLGSKAATLLA